MITLTDRGNTVTQSPRFAAGMWDNRSRAGGATNTSRPLTHSLDYGKEGLAMNATRKCSIVGCNGAHKGHGLCNKHIIRLRKTGTTDSFVKPQSVRFWAKVDKRGPSDCWEWTGATNEHGYGVMRPAGKRSGPGVKAHRYSAELAGMDIEGVFVRHRCDNPPCVNPAHLLPGTPKDNAGDMVERERHNRGSARPESKLTEAQVVEIKELLAAGFMHKDIAPRYGVSRAAISMINTGKSWVHVTPPAARDLVSIGTESLEVTA